MPIVFNRANRRSAVSRFRGNSTAQLIEQLSPGSCGDCVASCGDAQCGGDGCGGTCGECDFGLTRSGGQCVNNDNSSESPTCQCVLDDCLTDVELPFPPDTLCALLAGEAGCETAILGDYGKNGCGEAGLLGLPAGMVQTQCNDVDCAHTKATAESRLGSFCEDSCSCDGKQCGDDGCGSSCGQCSGGQTCEAGQCTGPVGCDVECPSPYVCDDVTPKCIVEGAIKRTTCQEAGGFAGCCGPGGDLYYWDNGALQSPTCAGDAVCGWVSGSN
ncbi:MAG: hypothetical protein ACI9OJ_003131, partial [Myxococcota bacterium]